MIGNGPGEVRGKDNIHGASTGNGFIPILATDYTGHPGGGSSAGPQPLLRGGDEEAEEEPSKAAAAGSKR